VYVKIPVLSPAGESSVDLIRDLSSQGVKLNVTAILSEKQIADVASLEPCRPFRGVHLRRTHRRYGSRPDADHACQP